MAAWTVDYSDDSTIADITDYVRLPELAAAMSGTPVEQALELTLYTTGSGFVPVLGGEIVVSEALGETKYRGFIGAIERTDASGAQVAGIPEAESYRVVAQSILARLKAVVVPNQTSPAKQADQELPPGFRAKGSGAALDASPMTPAEVLEWAVNLINVLEGEKDNGLPYLTFDPDLVANPTTQRPAADGGYEDITFTGAYAFFADNATYYELLDSIANQSCLRWWFDADLNLRTVDAVSPPILAYDISDYPDGGPAVVGHIVLPARTISLTEDITAVVNCVRASFEPEDDKVVTTTIKNLDSVAAYGERWKLVTTNYRTKEMARAVAWREVKSAAEPDYRGYARIRYTTVITPGSRCWVRQLRHGDDFLATVFGIKPVFEPGHSEPVWLDVEFSRQDWRTPTFSPLLNGDDKDGPDAPEVPTDPTLRYPTSGLPYLAPLKVVPLSESLGAPAHHGRVYDTTTSTEVAAESWSWSTSDDYAPRPTLLAEAWSTTGWTSPKFIVDATPTFGGTRVGSVWTNKGSYSRLAYEPSSLPSGSKWGADFSARFVAPATGTYTFYAYYDDAAEVTIDGTVVVNGGYPSGYSSGTEHSGTIALTAGTTYSFLARFRDNKRRSYAFGLSWAAPGGTKQPLLSPSGGYAAPFRAQAIGLTGAPVGYTFRWQDGGTPKTASVDQTRAPVAIDFDPSEFPLGGYVEALDGGGGVARTWSPASIAAGTVFDYEDTGGDNGYRCEFRPYLVEGGINYGAGSRPQVLGFSTGLPTSSTIAKCVVRLAVRSLYSDGRRVTKIAVKQVPPPATTATTAAGRKAWWREVTGGSDLPWVGKGAQIITISPTDSRISFVLTLDKTQGGRSPVPGGNYVGYFVISPIAVAGPVTAAALADGWPAILIGSGLGTAQSFGFVGPSLLATPADTWQIAVKSTDPTKRVDDVPLDLNASWLDTQLEGRGHSFAITQVGGSNAWTTAAVNNLKLTGRKGQILWNLVARGQPSFVPGTLAVTVVYKTGRKVLITSKVREWVSSEDGISFDISRWRSSGLPAGCYLLVSYRRSN